MKYFNGILFLFASFILTSCHKYAISKFNLGRPFEYKTKADFENYLNDKKIFDMNNILFPDSTKYLSFITEKLKQDSTVIYIGSYLNDSTCICKSDFLSKNTSCKSRIDEEIISNMNRFFFPDSMLEKVKCISKYKLKRLSNGEFFNMENQNKKLKIFMAYSYSFGTYYDNLYRKIMVTQKLNPSIADVFLICIDPVYRLE